MLLIFSGDFYETLKLINCNAFNLNAFKMDYGIHNVHKYNIHEVIFNSIMKYIPQLILSIYYFIDNSNTIDFIIFANWITCFLSYFIWCYFIIMPTSKSNQSVYIYLYIVSFAFLVVILWLKQ